MRTQTQTAAKTATTVSDPVIPATQGKFYGYSSTFMPARPIAFLMDCKANKARPLQDAPRHTEELDLVFTFDGDIRACAPNSAGSRRLLDPVLDHELLNQTVLGVTDITDASFNEIRENRDIWALVQTVRKAAIVDDGYVSLAPGLIFTVKTQTGKFALIRVMEVTESTVRVDACHILQ